MDMFEPNRACFNVCCCSKALGLADRRDGQRKIFIDITGSDLIPPGLGKTSNQTLQGMGIISHMTRISTLRSRQPPSLRRNG